MEKPDKQEQIKNKFTDIKIFNVPFPLEENNENFTITTSQASKEQIINQAFKFHSQGNISEAAKLYQYFINQGFTDYRVSSNYGVILKNLGKLKEAEIFTRKAIQMNPNYAIAYCNLGDILKDLGKLKEAEIFTRKAIQLNPFLANAFLNLGSIFIELENLKEAESATRKAIEINPDLAEAHLNLGLILRDLKYLNEAELSARKAIELNPNFVEAHLNLGFILKDLGNLLEAESSTRKVIQLNPNYSIAFNNLGDILKKLGKLKEAELSIRKAIQLKHDFAESYLNLGSILKDLGNLEEAESATRKAIELEPHAAVSHLNLGSILQALGKLKEAESVTRISIRLKPDLAEAYLNLGSILKNLRKSKEAKLSTLKAIELKPDFVEAYSNLGLILLDLGMSKEAFLATRKAIQINPDFAEAYNNLGNLFKDIGRYDDAISSYKRAIKLDINYAFARSGLITSKVNICDWSDPDIQSNWLKKLGIEGSSINPWNLFCLEDNPLKHLIRAQKLYKENFVRPQNNLASFKNKKIHVGYFSSDFRAHPTMFLISSILELHDKSKFQIYLYSFCPEEDKYTEIAKNSGCVFRDIKELNDIEAVDLARGDNLDIAIDLMGYIQYNRMSIFSYRVAPVQINYLGYPGSVGADNIDYILADEIIIPKEKEKFYSENIIRMPNCYQCNDNKKEICKEPISRSSLNLPDKGFIFTCFNSNYKITQKEFDIWMRLLKRIKGSVLWLYGSNELSVKNLYKESVKRDVDPNRLIFANQLPLNKHLARHSVGDLAIDTFNCNGHTTTSDALWAGLPVLTKIGESFAARVSASLLTYIGLTELITYSEKEYEEKALHLASDPEYLFKIKIKLSKLRETSTLYNSELFTRDLENKFVQLVN